MEIDSITIDSFSELLGYEDATLGDFYLEYPTAPNGIQEHLTYREGGSHWEIWCWLLKKYYDRIYDAVCEAEQR